MGTIFLGGIMFVLLFVLILTPTFKNGGGGGDNILGWYNVCVIVCVVIQGLYSQKVLDLARS